MIKNKKGFTLAELLIVVAIIAVLVAIAIPIFTTQLEKSREAVDLANVRSAYAKVMVAAVGDDQSSPNADGVTYSNGRWYISVDLKQKKPDWQSKGPFTIGSVNSTDALHWVGRPTPNGHCLISYSQEGGAVCAWEYNFAQIMNGIVVPSGEYKGKTVTQLLLGSNFTMLETGGPSGRMLSDDVRHQLGLKNTDDFSYKILPAKDYGKNYYEIYISETYELKSSGPKNQTNVGTIDVTGYVYYISDDGSSRLIKQGTPQTVSIYSNSRGEEKMDVRGNQDNCSTISQKAANTPYDWDAQ